MDGLKSQAATLRHGQLSVLVYETVDTTDMMGAKTANN